MGKEQPSSRFIRAVKADLIAPGIYEILPIGEIGTGAVEYLEAIFRNTFEKGIYKIVFNMRETSYITSSGIGLLISTTEVARGEGGNVIIVGAVPKVRQVFDTLGLKDAVQFAPSSADALKLLKKS